MLPGGKHAVEHSGVGFMNTYDLLVIGGGVSGLSAAVYAAESGTRVDVFEAG